ncbi:hypothetical protein [Nocardia sp. NPDC005998]|uniref:hypothetical protein n=1 Tax=Nocardia sp. NPDC005998 TaxID=3156894 RepID=UPI0033AE9647
MADVVRPSGQPRTRVPRHDTRRPTIRRCRSTSDLAHPTEAVYELIAGKIADDLLAKYTLGHLNAQSWPAVKPDARVSITPRRSAARDWV